MSQEKYTILQTISEGPVTTVYKAVQNGLGRTVLLKVLHKHLMEDDALVERLRREAAACATLRSDNIVQVYALDELAGAPAIVMEYVEGESLKDYLSRSGGQPEGFARSVAVAVLRGLAAAHARGIVHRDIKPGNLMVMSDGSVRITDFGLASIGSSSTLTAEGMLIGTPAYMSPEQARGEPLDHRTDLFSLGVTLLELLSTKQIFHGSSYAECINKILRFKVEDIDQIEFAASAEFRLIINRLMAEEKEHRYGSAEEALAALTGDRVHLRPGRVRSRSIIAAALPVVFASVAVLVWMYLPRPESETATAPSGRSAMAAGDSSAAASIVPRSSEEQRRVAPSTSGRSGSGVIQQPARDPRNVVEGGLSGPLGRSDSGSIAFACLPWGKVFLDGEYLGMTPLASSIRVPAGQHSVTFANPHFDPILRTITLGPDQALEVEADFLRNAGYLLVTVSPWAEIFIDDQFRDTTPLSSPIVVSAGTRMVRLRHPVFGDRVIQVSVSAGDTLNVVHRYDAESLQ